MNKADPESPRLTKNDQEILKRVILQGKISDSIIAKDLGISQQAVFKIRNKLESLGIIRGYVPQIDFKKVGINLLVLIGVKVNSRVWKEKSEVEVINILKSIPYFFQAYRVPGSDISHILMLGFSDIHQKDNFMKKIETRFADELSVSWLYTFSVDNILFNDPTSLLYTVIEKKFFTLDKLFLKE